MPEKDGPLLVLGDLLLKKGMPSLGSLASRIGDLDNFNQFVIIIRELLPEREQDILHHPTPAEQIAAFASYFEDRYFPLDDRFKAGDVDDVEAYETLVWGVPVIVMAMSYEDYHYISSDDRPGIKLMTYLAEYPYIDDQQERASLAEACSEHVSRELLNRVPAAGFTGAELHGYLDDTPYKGLALWSDYVGMGTGNFFLDTDYETLYGGGPIDWEKEYVDGLTTEWQQAEQIQQTMYDLAEWLEGDLEARFREIIDFILIRKKGD